MKYAGGMGSGAMIHFNKNWLESDLQLSMETQRRLSPFPGHRHLQPTR
jgi:hypothetical protein